MEITESVKKKVERIEKIESKVQELNKREGLSQRLNQQTRYSNRKSGGICISRSEIPIRSSGSSANKVINKNLITRGRKMDMVSASANPFAQQYASASQVEMSQHVLHHVNQHYQQHQHQQYRRMMEISPCIPMEQQHLQLQHQQQFQQQQQQQQMQLQSKKLIIILQSGNAAVITRCTTILNTWNPKHNDANNNNNNNNLFVLVYNCNVCNLSTEV